MNTKVIAASLAVGLTLPTFSLGMTNPALAATKKIPAGTVAQVMNKGLSVSEIYLNSFGKRNGNSWHKANDSYVNIYGFRQKFNIPEFTYKGAVLKRRRYIYNVNSVRSTQIKIKPQGKTFELAIKFESQGSEIKGMCRYKKLRKGYRNCVKQDGSAPDINWKNPGVRVKLAPQAYKGGIILQPTQVNVEGEFQMNGICKIGKDICNRFTGYKGKIKNAIADSVKSQLRSTQVKTKMASVTKQGLSKLNLPPIKSVKMEGGYVKVRF